MGILAGKKALIVGVASNRSIAWSIAEFMHQQGAELAFTYLDDKLAKRVNKIAEQTNSNIVLPCDVASDEQIKAVFDELEKQVQEMNTNNLLNLVFIFVVLSQKVLNVLVLSERELGKRQDGRIELKCVKLVLGLLISWFEVFLNRLSLLL